MGPRGYPFPLVLRPLGAEQCGGMPRYLAQRRRKQGQSEQLLVDAVGALNALEAAKGDGHLFLQEPCRAETEAELNPAQDSSLNYLGRACKGMLPKPDAH